LTIALHAQTADLVIENARVYTGIAAQPVRSGLAIAGNRVVAVADDVTHYAGSATRRIDAKGRTVVPGFVDSHVHMAALGELLNSFDLRHVKSTAEVAAMVKKAVSIAAPGEWIEGRAWDETNWGGQFPTAAMLDAVSPDNPVFLRRVDGHAGWANTAAMKAAGVTKETKDPPGGRLIRAKTGEPTGIFVDRAQALVAAKIPPATPAQIEKRLARAAEECARLGLTTIHDAGVGRGELDAYRRLLAANRLPVRVYAMIGGDGDLWREYLAKGPEVGDRFTVRSIKLVADGAMGSRGAAFWQPYSDDPGNTGLLILSIEQIAAVAKDAVAHGFQVNTHAIGDRANRTVLDAYAEALGGKNDKRFRIEHAQVVSLPDFPLFAKYSVIASMQSTHATSDMRWAAARLGPDRVQGAWSPKRFLALGACRSRTVPILLLRARIRCGDFTRQSHARTTTGIRPAASCRNRSFRAKKRCGRGPRPVHMLRSRSRRKARSSRGSSPISSCCPTIL
jgi:predicted amidohydrolase YtcJ